MGRRRCCCQPGCELGEDNFNDRVDGPVPESDPKWKVISGTWDFADGTVKSDGAGILATRICHPAAYDLGSFWATVDLIDPTNGAIYKIRAGNPESSTYEIHIEFTGTPGDGTIDVKVVASETTEYEYVWLSGAVEMTLCYAPGLMLSAIPTRFIPVDEGDDHWASACINNETGADNCHTSGGEQVGNFSFLDGTFDNWVYEVHWIENHDCKRCDCFCWKNSEIQCNKWEKYVTLTNAVGCPGASGTHLMRPVDKSYLGYWDTSVPKSITDMPQFRNKELWVSVPIPSDLHPETFLQFFLFCIQFPDDTEPHYELRMFWNTGSFEGEAGWSTSSGYHPLQGGIVARAVEQTCNPFYLRFPLMTEIPQYPPAESVFCEEGVVYDDLLDWPDMKFLIEITH